MALTGTGTQADPWIAHSYSELQTAFANLRSQGGTKYLELGNDIDCNDYGSSFTWSALAVATGAGNAAMIFDLKDHTIKNVQIASSSTLFTFSNQGQSIIKNGKIRNVFMNGSNGFCNYIGGLYTCSKLQNMSVSTNLTGVNANVFNVAMDSCAVYAEGSLSKQIFVVQPNVGMKLSNSDFLLKIDSCANLFYTPSGDVTSISNCRVRGKANTSGGATLSASYPAFENCVIDIETNASTLASYGSGSPTGVINTDKAPSGFNTRGLTAVSSAEIINGDALRAKGFVVVNVSA